MKTSELIVANQHFTLLELLDRLLDKGVVAKGEILLSVADIDLVYLNLGLLLSSVKTVQRAASRGRSQPTTFLPPQPAYMVEREAESHSVEEEQEENVSPVHEQHRQKKSRDGELTASALPSVIDGGLDHLLGPKASVNPENVERGLAKLVLTLVDLLRKLMEKQALRRMDEGQLTDSEIERMGNAFFLLDEKIEQLKKSLV